MPRGRVKTRYQPGGPRKGTQLRTAALLLLRTQGATQAEIATALSLLRVKLHGMMDQLDYMHGYDIRRFKSSSRGSQVVYRIVGKRRMTGSYRSFLRLPEDA